ncbi:HNH endonuclease, partial [Arthrobacter sp. HMWF013]|uniref:HNH endonuclease n=2 Tax=Micrococcaceae TaxID=1268 RepID=UPI000D47DFFC
MRTLVLNAGYEPLAVITFRRALVLVLTGKASVVAEGEDPVVGPQEILGRPSVILLNRYIRPRYNHSTAVSRRGVLRRDGHRCAYCGKAAHTID